MYSFINDLRYAGRALKRNPGFAAAAVLTLALGIGANAMVFGLMEATLLREPAVRSPETLAAVYVCDPGESRCNASYPDYLDYRERTTAFEDLAAYFGSELSVGTDTGAEVVGGELVSGNYFNLLGVSPARGRLLQPSDDDPASDVRVAVVSYEFWRGRLGGDPGAVGASVRINGVPFTVVGVVDPSFKGLRLGDSRSIWVPLLAQNDLGLFPGGFDPITMRGLRWIEGLVARLGSDVTMERARAEIRAVSEQLAAEYESNRDRRTVTLDPLRSYIRPNGSEPTLSTFVWILQGVVGFTLLLACANLANLLLARGSSRRRELAVRMAIGAGRTRLFHQLMTESLMLAVAGAAGGLLLASFALSAVGSFQLPFGDGFSVGSLDAAINLPVAGFTAVVALATVIAFGTLPALQGTRGDLTRDLGAGRASAGMRSGRLRRSLVGVQIAVCFILLVGAGLFLRTLRNQLATDFGFQPDGVAVMTLNPGRSGYSQAQSVRLAGEMIDALNGVPGVESASVGSSVPIRPTVAGIPVQVEGYTPAPGEEMQMRFADVGPDYFRTLQLPIERGREFTGPDSPGGLLGIVINRTMADAWWPGRNPLGGIVRFPGGGLSGTEQEYTVIGVVGEAAWEGLEKSTTSYAFRSLIQVQDSPFGTLRIIVRADPADLDSLAAGHAGSVA
ncbi:MAG: FtsX-like permease family protein [Gemmatimonas sp.]|nr:FtsX-like permease family protein [Gemmatimonas sp.]